ncbi:acid sphingomyelinase-like phosphodiesterase 3b [Chiloscyllium plagiosum]|uniref:acid sphingomyelinase-like phosphodiesterase 3b n=1 Tax=Chiloscyllium plagiosum TaxID=36176 RepID=UPI001CB84F38|nr:acid sphingomyelinase-like phosphodiesterase 3b [Chiloscyllium plagiosum]
MPVLSLLLLLVNSAVALSSTGYFWHITDVHWDPDYSVTDNPSAVCPSSSEPVNNPGRWGDYLCDSPWTLINSSIYAMKAIFPRPNFIIWTGDDTPHIPNEQLSEEAVLRIIGNVSQLIQQVFPDTKVYAAMGNHDIHPKSQFPANGHVLYNQTAELWTQWLEAASVPTFQKGAFYTEKLLHQEGQRMIVLNTNFYYNKNALTVDLSDPAGQLQWFDETLSRASTAGEKVYIIGHVPPGFFEKKRGTHWFQEKFNKRYIEIIQKHSQVIAGQFFGHQHRDSFKIFYSNDGSPISAMFIAPAVTPWKTTLAGLQKGSQNPGIRLFQYDVHTLQILDMVTYYLNLTLANTQAPLWEEEYRLTEAFQVHDGTAGSMQAVLDKLSQDKDYLQKYYEYNSVSYDLGDCDDWCRTDHICAIRDVDYARYKNCIKSEGSSTINEMHLLLCFFVLLCSMFFPCNFT